MEKKLQAKQQKITDYIDIPPLLTPDDLKWKKQHESKVKSGKRIRGTDPTYQHMQYYPVTLSSKQAAAEQHTTAQNKADLAKAYLSPITLPIHKKQKRVN